MSAIAEPVQHIHDDNLARRNAIVLAVAQALAGGNNTVVVATASIVGAMLAPDKGLATLPVTSSSNSARSNPKDTPKSNASGSGAASKRPDHKVMTAAPREGTPALELRDQ